MVKDARSLVGLLQGKSRGFRDGLIEEGAQKKIKGSL